MNSLYIYIGIVVLLLVVFLTNTKRNKTLKQERKTRSFKDRVAEKRAKENKKLK